MTQLYGVARTTSDVDFLVAFDEASGARFSWKVSTALSEALERVLGRPVDLIDPDRIANPYVLASVNCARELVYGA